MDRWSGWVTRHPRRTLVALAAVTVALALPIPTLEIDNAIDDMLPANHPARVLYDEVDEVFGGSDLVVAALESDDVFGAETLAQVLALTEAFARIEGVDEVTSLATGNRIDGVDGDLVVRDLMPELPETETERRALESYVLSDAMYRGTIVSNDGRYAGFMVELLPDADDATVYGELRRVIDEQPNPEAFSVAGGPAVNAAMAAAMQADLATLIPFVLGVLALVLYLSLRSARGVVVPLAVVLLSTLWTLGLMAWTGTAMAMISTTLPVMLIAIGVADAIHVLTDYDERLRRGEPNGRAIQGVLRHIGVAIALTSVTTAIGFLSLGVSPVTQVMSFGLFVGFGVMAALLVSLALIPALLSLRKPATAPPRAQADRAPRLSDRWLQGLGRRVVGARGWILAAGALLFALSAWGWGQLSVETNTLRFFRPEAPIRAATEVVDDHFGGSEGLSIVVHGDVKHPDVLNAMRDFQAAAEALPEVGYSVSIADYVAEINQALFDNDPARRVIPKTREAVAQELLLYEMSGDPSDLESTVNYAYDRARISLRMASLSSLELGRLVDGVAALAEATAGERFSVEITGSSYLFKVLTDLLVEGQLKSLLLSLLLVAAVLWLAFRSLRFGLLSLIPLGFTIALNFGLMGWLRIPLDTATTMIASIAIGIGVDYTVHFLAKYRLVLAQSGDPQAAVVETTRTTGLAILYNAAAVAAGFAVLLFSSFQPVATLGALVALTMGVSALAALTLLPAALLLWNRPAPATDTPETAQSTNGIQRKETHMAQKTTNAPSPIRKESRMRFKTLLTAALIGVLGLGLGAGFGQAADLSGREIIERVDNAPTPDDGSMTMTMTLINDRGESLVREMKSWKQGKDKTAMAFLAPEDVRGTAFLTVDVEGSDIDDMWLYLPSLDLTKRIDAASRHDAFVGSDFSYDDLGDRDIDDYEYTLLREDSYEDHHVFVVEGVALDPQDAGYSRLVSWIRDDIWTPVKVEYYGPRGDLQKVQTNSDIRDIEGFWTIARMTMENVQRDHKTVLEMSEIRVNPGVPDEVFTSEALPTLLERAS